MIWFLQFGVECYAVGIGLMAYIGVVMLLRKRYDPFTWYTCYFALQGIVMFVLLSQGNGDKRLCSEFAASWYLRPCWYRTAYWISEAIQYVLLGWILVEVFSRWRKKQLSRDDKYIFTGVVVTILFPAILQFREWVPSLTRDIPVYSMLVSQAIWIQGLILKPKEEA